MDMFLCRGGDDGIVNSEQTSRYIDHKLGFQKSRYRLDTRVHVFFSSAYGHGYSAESQDIARIEKRDGCHVVRFLVKRKDGVPFHHEPPPRSTSALL